MKYGKSRIYVLWSLLLGGSTALLGQQIPNNFVELDGNTTVEGTPCTNGLKPPACRDDWNTLNGDGTGANPGAPGGSAARSFVSGSASIAVFAGGGSKDPNDISQWKWKSGGTPDKDAITNGYAAAYKAPDGHLVLAFGADRFAVNGDANIGFWFFQQDVHPEGSGTGGGSPFSGAHTKDDIFVVSAFTQGGGVSTITVFTWDPACIKGSSNPALGDCAETNLRLRFKSDPNAHDCTTLQTGCADVNSAPISVSWPYLAKFGSNSNLVPTGGFYEGGIDVTALLGPSIGCFTSFVMETRSSQTPSAVLKDFVFGSFNICSMTSTKNCAGDGVLSPDGLSIKYNYNGTITNTGIGALSNVTIVDSLPAGSSNVVFKIGGVTASTVTCPTGSPSGATCASVAGGTLASGVTANWTVEFNSTTLSVQNGAYATASASISPLGACGTSGTVCSSSSAATCNTPASNSITISKSCAVPAGYPNGPLQGTQLVVQNNLAAVRVNFSGTISNTGQTPLSNVSVTDNPAANITVAWPGSVGVIPVGGNVKYSGWYLPSSFAGDGTVSGRYSFSDEIKITGATGALGSNSPPADSLCVGTFASGAQACSAAVCNICPAGATCAGN